MGTIAAFLIINLIFDFLSADEVKHLLLELLNKMFSKQNFDNDKYLQASLNGMSAVPIETIFQVSFFFPYFHF